MTISDQEQGVWYANNNFNIVFKPSQQVSRAILHFTVDSGAQQNLDMPKDGNTFNFAINNIHPTNKVTYSFTYFTQNGAADSQVFGTSNQTQPQPKPQNDDDRWVTVFFDDFNGPLDRSRWSVEQVSKPANNESQAYIDDPSTVRTENGCLILQCNRANAMGKQFTSGRINSMNKFQTKYGKIEARIKMPKCACLWSAFWLLANDGKTWGYGAAEIDVVEFVGRNNNHASGAINYDPWPHNKFVSKSYTLPQGNYYDDFHVFGINWQPDKIDYFIDNHLYCTFSPASLQSRWTCNEAEYYIVLNVACEGALGGQVCDSDVFPDRMCVDWVKVSQLKM